MENKATKEAEQTPAEKATAKLADLRDDFLGELTFAVGALVIGFLTLILALSDDLLSELTEIISFIMGLFLLCMCIGWTWSTAKSFAAWHEYLIINRHLLATPPPLESGSE